MIEELLMDVHAEEDPYDRQQLADIAGQFINVAEDTEVPVRLPAFHDSYAATNYDIRSVVKKAPRSRL